MLYHYSDIMEPGRRKPRLYLAKGANVVKFTGESIPGYAVIVTAQYTKAGIWSGTKYTLQLATGVRPIKFLSPLHGTWGDDLASWGQVAQELGLPIEVARKIVSEEYPSTAARLDAVEAFALEQEAQGATSETVVVSFGGPTRRESEEGYWEKPKEAYTSDGRRVVIAPTMDQYGPNWANPKIIEPEGAKIVSARHTRGYGGGYWAIEVVVPIGKNG